MQQKTKLIKTPAFSELYFSGKVQTIKWINKLLCVLAGDEQGRGEKRENTGK